MSTRMSDSEAIMWAVEKDPALRSDFCNLTILESRADPGRLRAKVDDALRGIPRLGQRVVSAPLRIVPPTWANPCPRMPHVSSRTPSHGRPSTRSSPPIEKERPLSFTW